MEKTNSTVQGEKEEEILEKQESIGTSVNARKNPYVREAQKEGEEARKARDREDGFVMPTKDNTMKAKGGRAKAQQPDRAKVDMDSGDESAATIPQSNIKPNMIQSPRKDLRHVAEGLKIPIFRGTLPRKYLYQYDLKLQVPASEDPVAALIQTAKAFWAR